MSTEKFKLAIVAPTAFFYQVALFKELAEHPRLDLTVYFCSEEGLSGGDIFKKFNTKGKWGVEHELLDGYNYKFLTNYSPRPSYLNWPMGLVNPGIWGALKKQKLDGVVLMSWMNPTWWMAILASMVNKFPIFYLTDTNVQAEPLKPGWKSFLKRLLLRHFLFKITSGFLCVGEANKEFYKYHGVPDSKLVDFAFTWGYKSLLNKARELEPKREEIRSSLGIAKDARIILYCGRLSPEKSPFTLLEAFERLELPGKTLIFVGDGKLRESLETYTAKHGIESVHFVGFQNRPEIPKYYAAADLLVVPSDREATGGVINEAMCFKLPVIISDQVGFGMDLVQEDVNGFSFPVGDPNSLAISIKRLFSLPEDERLEMGTQSLQRMTEWSERDLPGFLTRFLDDMATCKDGPKTEHQA